MTCAIVIPAYNEEARIRRVLHAARLSRLASEVVVVSDGSTDRTAELAAEVPGVRVVRLERNQGKGAAMRAGAEATTAEIIAFVDADLLGLRPQHIDALLRAVHEGRVEMAVGVCHGDRLGDCAQRITPAISGQRAMRRTFILDIPGLACSRMGAEIAIERYAKKTGARTLQIPLHGVSNTLKEQKMGLWKGAAARAKMYAEIGQTMLRGLGS